MDLKNYGIRVLLIGFPFVSTLCIAGPVFAVTNFKAPTVIPSTDGVPKNGFYSIGDSIAYGVAKTCIPGYTRSGIGMPAVARYIQQKSDLLKEQKVIISSGASNMGDNPDPNVVAQYITQQCDIVTQAGGMPIFLGVGSKFKPEVNRAIFNAAKACGGKFSPLTATGKEGVHPSPKALCESLSNGAGLQTAEWSQSTEPATALPANTGIVPASQTGPSPLSPTAAPNSAGQPAGGKPTGGGQPTGGGGSAQQQAGQLPFQGQGMPQNTNNSQGLDFASLLEAFKNQSKDEKGKSQQNQSSVYNPLSALPLQSAPSIQSAQNLLSESNNQKQNTSPDTPNANDTATNEGSNEETQQNEHVADTSNTFGASPTFQIVAQTSNDTNTKASPTLQTLIAGTPPVNTAPNKEVNNGSFSIAQQDADHTKNTSATPNWSKIITIHT